MKKKLLSALLAAMLVFLLAASVSAENAVVFVADSCERDGERYVCDGEYLRLNEDGTGEGCYNGVVFSFTWSRTGQTFTFVDEYGESMTDGVYLDDMICGTYRSYTYVFVRDEGEAGSQDSGEEPSAQPDEPQPVDASTARTYYPTSCTKDGKSYKFSGEYIVLNGDGTGMSVFYGCAYSLEWFGGDGDPFRFVDSKGNGYNGALDGDTLEGSFHGYSYTFRLGDNAPVTALSPSTWGEGLPYVTDQADILTDAEEEKLSARAEELSEQFGCNIYIVTLDNMENFSVYGKIGCWDEEGAFYTEAKSSEVSMKPVETCAEEIRTGYALGYGQGKDCVMLLLSMAERDFDLVAYGDFGNASFTDYGKEYLQKRFLDDFKDNKWYDGFEDYVDTCGEMLSLSREGKPVDKGSEPVNQGWAMGISLLLGFLVAVIVCCVLKGAMKNTKEKAEAEEYVPAGGVNIERRSDLFRNVTESRVYDPPQKSSSGGTSSSSSGHSHSSGKF